MEQELYARENRGQQSDVTQTIYETKKIMQETQQIMKERRLQAIKDQVQDFRDMKVTMKTLQKD